LEHQKPPIQKVRETVKAKKTGEVIIPNEVVNLHFPEGASLSLLASKLFVQIVDEAGANITADKEHKILFSAINWSHRDLGSLENVVRELQRTIIEIDVKSSNGRAAKESASILGKVVREIDTEAGELQFKFSETFRNVVANSSHWASIHARAVLAMEGKYSPWLYQLCAMLAGRRENEWTYDLDDLRSRLGANAPSMQRWPDFRRYALDPAIAEINHLTGLDVDYVPVKRGRRVVAITLIVGKKYGEAVEDARKELNNVRTGRKARRTGMVEKIADEKKTLAAKLNPTPQD